MKWFSIVFAGIFWGCLPMIAGGQEDREQWFREKWAIVESAKNQKDPDFIEDLGTLVRKMARDKASFSAEDANLYEEAKKALMSIPGHAAWYGGEIKRITDEEIAGVSKASPHLRWWCYETLAQLPTPETVGVLGDLLFDQRDPWKDSPMNDGGLWLPSSVRAVMALNVLGISNPPVTRREYYDEADLKTWQLWFEQVRAGNKTFSFEGDPQVYHLTGPATEAVGLPAKRSLPDGTQAGLQATIEPVASTSQSLRWLPLSLAGLLLAIGAWRVWRGSRQGALCKRERKR